MKKFIILMLIVFNHITFAQNKTDCFNIQQAVQLAYKNRPSLKAYKYVTQASKYNEKVAISGYLPQISLTSNEQFSTGAKGLQNNTTIQASQLIYSFDGPVKLYKIAKKATDISKLSEKQQKDLIRYEVETAFLQTWLLQEKNKPINSLKFSAQQTIKKSKHEKTLNLIGKNDSLKAASTYATNMSTVHIYIDELYNAQNKLEYLIGKPFKNENKKPNLVWNCKKEIKLKPLKYYQQLAKYNRKEIKQKQKEFEKYHEYQKYYKNNYLPEINMTGQISRADQTRSNNVGLSLSWNLFDGASNFHESQKANANKLKSIQEKEHYLQQVKYEVENIYRQLNQYLKQLVAKNIELTQAENEYNLQKLKFNIGDISKVDLDTTQYTWENKKFDWLTLKINTAIMYQELFYTCGYPKNI